MSAYCEANNLPGFARWLRIQFEEEMQHGLKLFDYINDRGGRIALQAITQPQAEFESVMEVFQQTLDHEQHVTALIHKLYTLAVQENDYTTQIQLQWFITEQVEEEKNAGQIVEQLKMSGLSGAALLLLDRELGARAPEKAA
jgi:ferritin